MSDQCEECGYDITCSMTWRCPQCNHIVCKDCWDIDKFRCSDCVKKGVE